MSGTKPRSLSVARAKTTSQYVVTNYIYFDHLKEDLSTYKLMDKPRFSIILMRRTSDRAYANCKCISTPAVTPSRSSPTTVIRGGNALGTWILPYFIFQGQRMRQGLMEDWWYSE